MKITAPGSREWEELEGTLPSDLVNALAFDPNYAEVAMTNKNLIHLHCFKIFIRSHLSSICLLEILSYLYCHIFFFSKKCLGMYVLTIERNPSVPQNS